MHNFISDPVGAAWLVQKYQIPLIADLPIQSQIGSRRDTQSVDGSRLETYPVSMRPSDEPAAHLQFHLRHEVINLEFLARLFAITGPSIVQDWVNNEPTGQYSRRAAFLYEWLTADVLSKPDRLGGGYVDALDDKKMITASIHHVNKEQRWRVNNNLPGTPSFCPIILKTEATNKAIHLDVFSLIQNLSTEFGEDILQRSAVWMTLRESKASFSIEGENNRASRIERFADVMSRRTGKGDYPLDEATLAQLQSEILGERTTLSRLGLRQSPVFVGQTIGYQELVHYIAPPHTDILAMLGGGCVFFLSGLKVNPRLCVVQWQLLGLSIFTH